MYRFTLTKVRNCAHINSDTFTPTCTKLLSFAKWQQTYTIAVPDGILYILHSCWVLCGVLIRDPGTGLISNTVNVLCYLLSGRYPCKRRVLLLELTLFLSNHWFFKCFKSHKLIKINVDVDRETKVKTEVLFN